MKGNAQLLTVVAGIVRVCGWVAVIAAALAVLAAGMACSLASAPRVRPADTSWAAPAAGPHPAGTRTGGGGQAQSAGAEIDPAYFSPGACVAFPPTMGNRHLTVFLDAGHGGPDPGAVGISRTGQVIYEADQTLPVVLNTTTILRRAGFRVVVSRTGPTSVLRLGPGDLSGRVLSVTGSHDDVAARDVCANMAHADVLVGVYFNSGPTAANAGCLTAYDSARPFATDNRRLADLVQSAVLAAMNAQGWHIPDDGAQPDQGLGSTLTPADHAYGHLLLLGPAKQGYFSTPSTMPGALVEPLFLTDPFEGSIAASSHGQQVIAAGLASAIEQYFAPGPRHDTDASWQTAGVEAGLRVQRGGSGEPVLLLLHGLGATGDVWDGWRPLLARRWPGRWLVPDLPGHGGSRRLPEYTFDAMAAAVADIAGGGRTVVLGHSLGGVVGLVLAGGGFPVPVHAVIGLGIKVAWTRQELDRAQANAHVESPDLSVALLDPYR